MKMHKDVQRAIDAYAESLNPVLCGPPEPDINWEDESLEDKTINNLADTVVFIDQFRGSL